MGGAVSFAAVCPLYRGVGGQTPLGVGCPFWRAVRVVGSLLCSGAVPCGGVLVLCLCLWSLLALVAFGLLWLGGVFLLMAGSFLSWVRAVGFLVCVGGLWGGGCWWVLFGWAWGCGYCWAGLGCLGFGVGAVVLLLLGFGVGAVVLLLLGFWVGAVVLLALGAVWAFASVWLWGFRLFWSFFGWSFCSLVVGLLCAGFSGGDGPGCVCACPMLYRGALSIVWCTGLIHSP